MEPTLLQVQYNNLSDHSHGQYIFTLVHMIFNYFCNKSLKFTLICLPYCCQQLMLGWVRGERGVWDSAAGSVSVSWCPGHIMGPIITLIPLLLRLLRCGAKSVTDITLGTIIVFQLTSRCQDTGQEIQPGCDHRPGICCSSKT